MLFQTEDSNLPSGGELFLEVFTMNVQNWQPFDISLREAICNKESFAATHFALF